MLFYYFQNLFIYHQNSSLEVEFLLSIIARLYHNNIGKIYIPEGPETTHSGSICRSAPPFWFLILKNTLDSSCLCRVTYDIDSTESEHRDQVAVPHSVARITQKFAHILMFWVTLDLSVLFFEIKENFSKSPRLKKTSSNPGSNHARTSLIRPPYFQYLQDPGCRNEFIVILANEQTVDWHSLLCHIWYQDFASFQPLRNLSPLFSLLPLQLSGRFVPRASCSPAPSPQPRSQCHPRVKAPDKWPWYRLNYYALPLASVIVFLS